MQRTVPEAHSELLHYTSAAGLLGILESQSLRATHSAFLNDSMEIALFFEQRLAKIVESAIQKELAADPALQVLPQFAKTPQEAESVIARYVIDMADAIRTTTQRFNEPYFACFSAPANKRIRTDGLLSQWRGYGKDGGTPSFAQFVPRAAAITPTATQFPRRAAPTAPNGHPVPHS